MADMRVIGAMDRLWFHQIILFPEPTSQDATITLVYQNNLTNPSASVRVSSLPEAEISKTVSLLGERVNSENSSLDDPNQEDEVNEIKEKNRPRRISVGRRRSRSHSFSPSTQKHQKNYRYSGNTDIKLPNTMSCRSLRDLELEEVKGFMDLGFIFKKEHMNQRMMRIIPGLQRLGFSKNKDDTEQAKKDDEEDDTEQEEEEEDVMRPYLSEAWLIKRPNSPLLNLKLPRVFAASDVKKHLRFWARTVASEMQQEY